MGKEKYENWGDVIYWVYANLNMLRATLERGKEKYDRQSYMIRSKAYKAYHEGRWQIHSLYEDNNWKVDLGKERCWYCHRPIAECGRLAIEHILPKSLGGDDSFDNIAYACRSCNSSKGSKDFIDWTIKERGNYPSIELICIYMKLIYKFSMENNLMELHGDDMKNMILPFNPRSVFNILCLIENWHKRSDLV